MRADSLKNWKRHSIEDLQTPKTRSEAASKCSMERSPITGCTPSLGRNGIRCRVAVPVPVFAIAECDIVLSVRSAQ
jgi:hypothetical protein